MGVEELLDATDEEDFTEELEDFTELLLCLLLDDEFTDELDLAELLLDFTEELDLAELLLEPSLSLRMTLEEEPGVTEEVSPLILEDDSSSSTAELCALFSPGALVEPESSPQALKANSAKATALVIVIFLNVFMLKLC